MRTVETAVSALTEPARLARKGRRRRRRGSEEGARIRRLGRRELAGAFRNGRCRGWKRCSHCGQSPSRAASLFYRRENQPPRQYLRSKNECDSNLLDRPTAWGKGPFSRRNPKNLTFRAAFPRRVRSRLPPPAVSQGE